MSMRSRGEKGLVPFFTAGYPDEETFLRLIRAASDAGCKVIEIGVPFSDPIADGPAIQESSSRALENGISLNRTLELAVQAREKTSARLVLMGYFNPVLQMGLERFARRAGEAGVAGVIIPDVPLEESTDIRKVLEKEEVTFVDLVARTSSADRIKAIAGCAKGFLYLVSVTGVTGVRSPLSKDLEAFVARVREEADIPLYVGFGVSNRDLAVQAVHRADGVIIGSALIRIIQSAATAEAAVTHVKNFLEDIHQAINPSRRP